MDSYLRRCTAGCVAMGLLGLFLGWVTPPEAAAGQQRRLRVTA